MGPQRPLWCSTIYLTVLICAVYGCDIQGVTNAWLDLSVTDTDTGIFFQGSTENIGEITSATHSGDGLNFGPYFVASHEDSQFVLSLHENFALYERYETLPSFTVSVTFSCTNGNAARTIIFIVSVIDTNNNDPIFTPMEEFSYTVTPPLPPGYQITGCVSDINVEDIDLTTQRIDFNVENGDGLFEIVYDPTSSVSKNFKGILRTTNFVRSIPEPLILTISATDVDLTGDPQRTTYTTIRIESDGEFEFPDEPVFSQAFYLAAYSEEHEISVDPISLIQGYANDVDFNLTGVYSQYFNVAEQNNVITISVTNQLPSEVLLNENQLYLVLNAFKDLTSGASATVVVQLPEAQALQFEQQLYEGTIVDNVLSAPVLVLSQGYDNGYTVLIDGEHSGNFAFTTESNSITLTMTELDDNVIEANNVITLQVTVDSGTSAATAFLSLNIIKNDTITPLFESNLYSGIYNPTSGLALQDVVLSQGYDETVSFYLEGEHESLFTIIENSNVVSLQVNAVPQDVIDAGRDILLTLSASKARTVGANTAISIALPRARELVFEHPSYTGLIQDNLLILEPISLTIGYDEDVNFNIIGDYYNYFTATNIGNVVTVALTTDPDDVILENNNIVLILEAEGTNALKTSTSIVLEIIKEDTLTPVFSQNIYEATYSVAGALEMGIVSLTQGYDDTVLFRIDGEHSQYFALTTAGNSITLSLPILPEEVVFSEKTLIFNVIADKPLTVGASAAVAVSFPQEYTEPALLSFSANSYVGTLENGLLSLENLVLELGYAAGTEFTLTGEYEASFTLTTENNIAAVSLSDPLPTDALQNNKFLVLQITAQRERAVPAAATVIIEINTEDEIPPVFAEPYYRGTYTIDGGLEFPEAITLTQVFEETVTFDLEDDVAEWFTLQQNGNSIILVLSNPIPEETVYANRQLLFSVIANRGNVTARTAVSIDLPDESPTLSIRFASSSHVGRIEDGTLELLPITLLDDYQGAEFNLLGDYSGYFVVIQNDDTITLEPNANNPLPEAATLELFIVLDVEATRDTATAYTAVVLEIVRETDTVPTPVFSQPYYSGSYSPEQGLLLEETISLIQGYSEDVQFALQGDEAQGFVLTQIGNSVTLTIAETGLPETDRTQLLFSVEATRAGALTGNAAIVINLSDLSTTTISFASNSHVGRIEGGILYLGPITVLGDFEEATFNIFGEYSDYFNVNQNGDAITLELLNQLPDEVMLVQSFVVLDIEATRDTATAYTAVVLEIVRETDPVPTPVFSQPYYSGSYSPEQGLLLEETISLIQGYSEDVQFALQGDDAQGFVLTQTGNSVTLTIAETGLPETDRTQLLFSVEATRAGALTGNAAIVINLSDLSTTTISFASNSHVGRIEGGILYLGPITVLGDFEEATFNIFGEYSDYFNVNQNGDAITLELLNQLPDEVMLVQSFVVLDIEATRDTATAYTAVVLEIVRETDPVPTPVFSQPYYSGSYSPEQGLLLEETISLIQGYSEDVQFALQGDDAQGFVLTQTGNSVTLTIAETGLPETDRTQLLFSVEATRAGALTGNAAIVINLSDLSTTTISFASNSHVGRIESGILYLDPISVLGDFEEATFNILGEYSDYFNVNQNGDAITLELLNQLPDEVMLVQSFVVLDIEATRDTATAYTAVVLEIVRETDPVPTPVFSQPYYSGSYSPEQGLLLEETISLVQGYSEDVQFALQGDDAQGFVLTQTGNSVSLTIGEAGLPETNRTQLLFSIQATRAGALTGNAAIVINLADLSTTMISFASNSHVGRIESGILYLDPITVLGDSEGATFNVFGTFGAYFNVIHNGDSITLELINQLPDEVILVQTFVVLDIEATIDSATAYTAVVLEIVRDTEPVPTPVFSQPYYSGSYSPEQGLLLEETISLIQGYSEDVQFTLQGDDAQGFDLTQIGNRVTLTIAETGLPETDRTQLLFSVEATRTGTLTGNSAVFIALSGESTSSVAFDRALYRGLFDGSLQHEPISVSGYKGTEVEISGEYNDLFEAQATSGVVSVQALDSLVFSTDILYVGLELLAGSAHTALVIDINHSEQPEAPMVLFESSSYEISTDVTQTGLVGRVQATASNGEPIVYSLAIDNAHLEERLSISSDGELQLFATADTGIYNFAVIAVAAASQASATATVRMNVDAIAVCGDDEYVVPPLIVINRDEEENHSGLVVLSQTEFPGCSYEMTNRFPLNQDWLYVDDAGLHTTAIDREDESIAFMALSQVQVELILVCDSDNAARSTRAKRDARPDWLGPYDYGNNEWVLTETILHNSRRTLVNLVVNDINDNAPVFVDKENEPIAVGYPTADLLQVVMPRALTHLKATDRDIGINAELVYWSSAVQLAVGPTTGTVHVRDNQRDIAEGTVMTIHATDQAGEGLTGDIDIVIRLLDDQHIAVVTIRDAFEEDEAAILENLTDAIGYEVKSLTSVVISDEYDDNVLNVNSRRKRQAVASRGASLRLFVYGLIERDPVEVSQLTNDINNNVIVSVAVADTVSLQDYLESLEICEVAAGRDIGLLVATIVLSVVLFILIVLIGLWFFLRWRKERNYEEFSDMSSVASRNDSSEGSVKVEPITRPRLAIEEIKRSERRLREMLDAPDEEVVTQPSVPTETIVDIPASTAPIVIQSIDKLKDANDDSDDDEFGERKQRTRKKSVVTFNENVEKIIHVEDDPDDNDDDIEVYKL